MASKSILVVEDNPANLQLVEFLLKSAGFTVSSACNGIEAIEKAGAGPFDLILMDVEMPEMDGLTAARKIKGDPALAHIPVVALTSYAMKGDKERCLASGCSGYITKPISTREFVKTVSGFLEAGTGGL